MRITGSGAGMSVTSGVSMKAAATGTAAIGRAGNQARPDLREAAAVAASFILKHARGYQSLGFVRHAL